MDHEPDAADLPRAWHFGEVDGGQPDGEEPDLGYEAALPGLQALLAGEALRLAP